jgi:cytochrome c peroxidase
MTRMLTLGAIATVAIAAWGSALIGRASPAANRRATHAQTRSDGRPWDAENPIRPLATPPLGMAFYLTQSKDTVLPVRARLGRWLFFDARLSVDGSISCATCHRPAHGFSEPTSVSTGVQGRKGTRKTPSLLNQTVSLAWHLAGRAFFSWDGRAGSLEEQILLASANPLEMANPPQSMARRLSAIPGYRPYFKEVFGTAEINDARVAQAIADYVRTRVSGNSAYDRFNAGDNNALTPQARLGQDLFFDKAGCGSCHLGENFTGGVFHTVGVGWDPRTKTFKDEGRFLVTKNARDRGAFKVPGLRDVSRRAPYMHDGSIPTLRDVVLFYNRGGADASNLTLRMRKPLGLSDAEVNALVAFLQSLDGEGYLDKPPTTFPR